MGTVHLYAFSDLLLATSHESNGLQTVLWRVAFRPGSVTVSSGAKHGSDVSFTLREYGQHPI